MKFLTGGAVPTTVDEEAAARDIGAGMWRGEFVFPWDWRRGTRMRKCVVILTLLLLFYPRVSFGGDEFLLKCSATGYEYHFVPIPDERLAK